VQSISSALRDTTCRRREQLDTAHSPHVRTQWKSPDADDLGINRYDFPSVTAFRSGGGDFLAYDTTVPEPSMVLLCVLGGLGFTVGRRFYSAKTL